MYMFSFNVESVPNARLIGHVTFDKPWSHSKRSINEYILFIMQSGDMFIEENGTKYHLVKGDILLLEPNKTHVGYEKSKCSYYYIHFKYDCINLIEDYSFEETAKKMVAKRNLSLTDNIFAYEESSENICFLPKNYHYEKISELIYILLESHNIFYKKYEFYKKLVSLKLLEIFIRISREFTTTELEKLELNFPKSFIKVRKIVNYLNNEYMNQISSKNVEEIFESNYDYLNREFKKMTGYTILNYLNLVRINKSKDLMNTSNLNFAEIGYSVGIMDPYYFSKLFKKYTGVTATEFCKNEEGSSYL